MYPFCDILVVLHDVLSSDKLLSFHNIQEAVHPIFNIVDGKADDALNYFKALPECTFVYD